MGRLLDEGNVQVGRRARLMGEGTWWGRRACLMGEGTWWGRRACLMGGGHDRRDSPRRRAYGMGGGQSGRVFQGVAPVQ